MATEYQQPTISPEMDSKIPILLLKTKSTPRDRYEEYFEELGGGCYRPVFIPVLQHTMLQSSLETMSVYIMQKAFAGPSRKYGGVIFTSQRAVEAFAHIVSQMSDINTLIDADTVFYVVGPATRRAVESMKLERPILGEETGNGEALAAYTLKDYNSRWRNVEPKPALLFPVGEQRRDIIPKMLQSEDLPVQDRIKVEEIEVYATIEHPDFADLYHKEWEAGVPNEQWTVVFSPSGCQTMLGISGLRDNKSQGDRTKQPNTKIATIGPTTKAYLEKEFDYEPDVCAPSPTPESLGDAIHALRSQKSD